MRSVPVTAMAKAPIILCVALCCGQLAGQVADFVYEVRDGVFESGDRYSTKLEELERRDNGALMRFTYSSGASAHMAPLALFRGVCEYMSVRGKSVSEVRRPENAKNLFQLEFLPGPDVGAPSQRDRFVINRDMCLMSQPVRGK